MQASENKASVKKTEVKLGIDLQKLGEAGVSEKVAASLDPRDGGNITRQGDVLYLDEKRMHRKERLDRALWHNHPHGIGIKDWLVTGPLATTPATWWRTLTLFHFLIHNMHRLGERGAAADLFRRLMMQEPVENTYTHGNVMQLNLDMDFTDKSRTSVVPYDLVMDMIDRADYVAIMNHCLCRSAGGCTDGRENIGCIFLNASGAISVKNGIAKEASKEEARAHVHRAMEAGLMGHVLWVQLEQLIWGVPNHQMDELVEICFCDPEYCVALRSIRAGGDDWKARFKGTGFTAVVNHDMCAKCKSCVDKCPQDAIAHAEDGGITINQDKCFGCGFCKEACPKTAIQIKQTMPMRASVEEYFEKEGRLRLADTCTAEPPEPGYSWESEHARTRKRTKRLAAAAGSVVATAAIAALAIGKLATKR